MFPKCLLYSPIQAISVFPFMFQVWALLLGRHVMAIKSQFVYEWIHLTVYCLYSACELYNNAIIGTPNQNRAMAEWPSAPSSASGVQNPWRVEAERGIWCGFILIAQLMSDVNAAVPLSSDLPKKIRRKNKNICERDTPFPYLHRPRNHHLGACR